jgi:hypothetical protein
MANRVISIPLTLSELDMQHAPVESEYWPARSRLDGSVGELAESPARRSSAARGALLGILVGTALYGAVLILFGVIKL